MSNLTVDDTSSTLSYGPGWGVASSSDPALNKYFLSTYHASESPGAIVNLSFPGTVTAIYLYGSRGPNCGTFSVRWDGNIQQSSAFSSTQGYQQLLFGVTFLQTNNLHTLTLNNTSDEQGPKWLDLDFFTITDGSDTSTASTESMSTISPLSVPKSITAASPVITVTQTLSIQTNTQSSCSSSSCHATLYVSIVLGIIIFFLLLLGLSIYVVMKNRFRTTPQIHTTDGAQRRLGSKSTQPNLRFPGSAFLETQSGPVSSYQDRAPAIPFQSTMVTTNAHAPVGTIEPIDVIDPEKLEGDMATPGYDDISYPHTRDPFSGNAIRALFGGVKKGADSMKSSFLKV